jgi:cytochrome c oxidase subunit 4
MITNASKSPTAYWIAFGPHGPRALDPPGEGKSLLFHIALVLCGTLGLYTAIRSFARGHPDTMTQEYQEQTNEFLKVRITRPVRTLQP